MQTMSVRDKNEYTAYHHHDRKQMQDLRLCVGAVALIAALAMSIAAITISTQNQTAINTLNAEVAALDTVVDEIEDADINVTFTLKNNGTVISKRHAAKSGKRSLLETLTPTSLAVKIVSISLIEDLDVNDDPVGLVQAIYINPDCQNNLTSCGLNASNDRVISTALNIGNSNGSAAINAASKGTTERVQPGTYRYVTIKICDSTDVDVTNVAYLAVNMSSTYSFLSISCDFTVAIAGGAVVVPRGTGTIKISYDIYDLVNIYSSNQGDNGCTTSSPWYCLTMPTFTATASLTDVATN